MDSNNIQKWFFDRLVSRLAAAIQVSSGERPELRWKPENSAPDSGGFRWRQSFEGVAGALWIVAGQGGLPAAINKEMLARAFTGVAQDLSARSGRDVACGEGKESSEPTAGCLWARISVESQAGPLEFFAGAAQELIDAASEEARPSAQTFDLLLDVELPVSVSFGRAQIPLKDVLKLTTGAIIELNRSIAEPVEVIVNNCVIARGEVVVVEGNFGVRIQQVISRQERLRTLN